MEVRTALAAAALALLAATGCGPNGTVYAEHVYSYFANPGEQCKSAESARAEGTGPFETVDSVTLRVEPYVVRRCCYTEVSSPMREVCLGTSDAYLDSYYPAGEVPACPATDDRALLVSPGPFQPGARIVTTDILKCTYTWKGQEKRT